MYGLMAIKDSGGLLTGEIELCGEKVKLGYYSGNCEGGPYDGTSFACCVPIDRYTHGEWKGHYRHDARRNVWVWFPCPNR